MKVCPRCLQLALDFTYPKGGKSAYCAECSAKISRRLPIKVVVVQVETNEGRKPRLGQFGEATRVKLDFLKKRGCSVYAQVFGTDDLYEWRTFKKQPLSRKTLRQHMIDREGIEWVDVHNGGRGMDVVEVLGGY